MLEAILFDFDGTLVDFVASDIQSLRWLHAYTGMSVPFEDFLETAVSEIMRFHQLVEENQIDPLLMHEFRLKNTLTQYEIPWENSLVNLYQEQLVKACLPVTGAETLLQTIRPRVKLGLVTNAYDGKEQRARIQNSGLNRYFDLIIVAGEIGVFKPDPAIFSYAVAHIKTNPGRTLFVGDSVRYDVEGAKAAGLMTLLLANGKNKQSEKADFIVKNIAALIDLLDHLLTSQPPAT